jgi:DNA-binding GntR family transcriptional regulator
LISSVRLNNTCPSERRGSRCAERSSDSPADTGHALHCDIRIGCEQTRFTGYYKDGQIIEYSASYYLPKLVDL